MHSSPPHRRKASAARHCALLFSAAAFLYAQGSTAREADDIVAAPEPLRTCVVCHGVELMGNRAVDAPKLAGLPAWYVRRQMEAFRNGWRGVHEDDVNGMEMRPQATALTAAQVEDAVAFAAAVPERPAPATVSGDAARGQRLYQSCAACHGVRGEGNETLLSPPLAGQNDWYLVSQLELFRSGARGSAPDDAHGAIMRAAAQTLTDDQATADVVAYINTLEEGENPMKNKTVAAAALAAGLSRRGHGRRHPLPAAQQRLPHRPGGGDSRRHHLGLPQRHGAAAGEPGSRTLHAGNPGATPKPRPCRCLHGSKSHWPPRT
ncbi:MAG: c-type cytochrome [Gammaproteobacteria bacterium]|nr:c-type cytochrome [Gammaproteobacteria bacterium]